jgi:predicted metal-binding protein
MDKEQLESFFKKSNLSFLKTVSINDIVFDERAKYMCKFGCKNYDRKHSCPPASLYLKEKVLKNYDSVILIATTYKIPDMSSIFKIRNYNHKKECEIQSISLILDNFFKLNNIDHIALSGGPCQHCKICSYSLKKKCIKPMKRQTSMEAIGIDCHKTMHNAGFDFFTPNIDTVNRCGCIFINDKNLFNLNLKKRDSYQNFFEPKKQDILTICSTLKKEYPKLFNKIRLLKISEIIKEDSICNSYCQNYNSRFSCPPYSEIMDLTLWNYSVLWEWNNNKFNKNRYNLALKKIHSVFYSMGFYFALSLRDCYCDECEICTYKSNEKTICNFRRILSPSVQSQGINPKQFGNGKFGIELL